MKFTLFFLCSLLIAQYSFAADNTIDDMFQVKELKAQQAVASGKTAGLKAGDYIYFSKSPFRFKIEKVEGNLITINLPNNHEVAIGNNFIRNPTPSIQKSISTENRLKSALEE